MTKPSPPQEVSSRSWLGLLLVAGLIVAAVFCVGLAMSAAWYSVTPRIFESSATLLIEPREPAALIQGQ